MTKIEAATRLRQSLVAEDITYEQYCAVLHAVLGSKEITALSLPSVLMHFFDEYKKIMTDIAQHLKISKEHVVEAFKERSVFKFLAAVKFSLKAALKAVKATTALMHYGLLAIVKDLEHKGVFKHLQKGAHAVDEFLDAHPLFRKLAGPALAGLMIWIWFHMSFSGHVDSDLALTSAIDALRGHFSIYDLFASKAGIEGLVLLALGMSGMSLFDYLSESTLNFLLALFYTAAHKLKLRVPLPHWATST